MKYQITNIRSKDIVWSGGTFKKFECTTDKTGADVLELRLGPKTNEKTKVGDVIEGYLEKNIGKDGKDYGWKLAAIDAKYVYRLLLSVYPDIEKPKPAKVGDTDIDYPERTGEIPWP